MNEPLPTPDDESSARCPVPEWAAWPIAVGVPLLAIFGIVWFLFLR